MLSPSLLERSSSIRENVRLAALEYSILEERPAVAKQCMDDGVDVNAITPFSGVRPLELALEMRDECIMRLLLQGGADTEGENAQGSTALINASRYGYLECVKLLVEHGASLYALDDDGKTSLHAALERRRKPVVKYLLEQDASKRGVRPTDDLCLLQHLIVKDDAALISNLTRCRVGLNASCPDGTVLVFFATKNCKNNALKALLGAGADPNTATEAGEFALHEAVRQNNARAVKDLIKHGANVLLLDKDAWSPIETALQMKHLSMLGLLLDCGADIEQDLSGGATPLVAACSTGFLEGVKLLVKRGANLKTCTKDGETCLFVALKHGHQSTADYLLDQEVCEVNGIGRDGFSALHHAVLLNNTDLMRKLIRKQASVNAHNNNGEVPVFLAARDGKVDLLRMLLEAAANPNIASKEGNSPLHEAVKRSDFEAVKLLLQHEADRDRLDKNGKKAVEVAVTLASPRLDIIHCLLANYMDELDSRAFNSAGNRAEDNIKISDAEMEQSLRCPITCEIMKDPVIAMDGHTYERKAIEEWLQETKESPVTRQPMTSATLIPNLAIKHLIDQFADIDSNP